MASLPASHCGGTNCKTWRGPATAAANAHMTNSSPPASLVGGPASHQLACGIHSLLSLLACRSNAAPHGPFNTVQHCCCIFSLPTNADCIQRYLGCKLSQHLLTRFSGLLQSSCMGLCSGMLPTVGNAACCSKIPAAALKLSKRPLNGTTAPAAGGSARQLQPHSGQHGTGDH